MFEELARGDALAHVDDAALVTAITGWTRAEATAAAHRMAAIAELTDRRGASEQATERQFWACDAWDSAAAEVATASGISARVASNQMHQALALRYRLPQIAKLMTEGTLAPRLANTIAWRTQLIEDPEVLARVEADLAEVASSFGSLSVSKLEAAIDAAITVHDPAAVRREQTAAKGCDLEFGSRDDTTGTISMWGRLSITDGELFQRRVEQMARRRCSRDPRSAGDRRTAVLGVLGAGGTFLPCGCGHPDCTATGPDARADAIVIHVLTDHLPDDRATAQTQSLTQDPTPRRATGPDPRTRPDGPEAEPDLSDAGPPAAESAEHPPQREPSVTQHGSTAAGLAVIAGGGIVPTALLSELIGLGATVRPVPTAAELCTEPRYRPSAKLARYVRSRDLTCCFPGCDRPAERCDLDHTTPHGVGGPTHPGNTKCLCRKHHLLKTFWTGSTGWTDQQLADGTVVWISPTGHRYTRPPGSRMYFPHWNTHTPLPAGTATPPVRPLARATRGLRMPTRKKSRVHDRTQRLHAERRRNQRAIDEDEPPY